MIKRILCILVSVVLASGCTTSAYLKPVASAGTYSSENPSCGGNLEVLEFSPPQQSWLVIRVYARQTHTSGTALMVSYWMRPWSGLTTSPGLFSKGSESDQKVADQRWSANYLIATSKNSVSVELPSGVVQEVNIPSFHSPYQLGKGDFTFWPSPVKIAPVDIDEFTVTFPKIRVNDEELKVPPIHFKKNAGGQVDMILNC